MALTWPAVAARDPIWLNLGGRHDCHPHPLYQGYVSVDAGPPAEFVVSHDLTRPIPLADGTVDRFLSEHFLEHLDREAIAFVLAECHRLLRPGGLARLAVPDYQHPRNRFCLALGRDPRRDNHRTLTTFALCRDLVATSPFRTGEFHQYWDGDRFVHGPIDYGLGYVRRTPENDVRNRAVGAGQLAGRFLRDIGTLVRRGPFVRRIDFLTRRYHALASTSVVFDLRRAPS